MKIVIDREKCIGCGSCEATCPEIFRLIEDGKSSVVERFRNGSEGEGEIGVELFSCANRARDLCPAEAIATE